MLNDIKQALRISSSMTAFDDEVQDLIEAARIDLIQSGVSSEKANDDTDALIKRAITVYCKANFGYDNPDAERFEQSYKMLKQHLSLAGDYNATQ
ncbi:head-tail connector protein [Tuberibacillus sp. Marseille-P3662]|uniref:head-tail connector protein n=1 Tax=Tuberibacillus sp. Marseille-P3662 TaxID=1965358 RepID=UPI000A1CCED9|nr:head-tail connector protein [Tuberibacillus sp. Marseille-P3662]